MFLRRHRSDCKQGCIGLVVTPQGLPIAYEVFAGNRNDVTTLQEMVRLMEDKYCSVPRFFRELFPFGFVVKREAMARC